jgi:hypothetical protein
MTDGLRPVPGDSGALTIRGGVGGIRFQWEELDEAARVLGVLAGDAGEVAVALGYLEIDTWALHVRVLSLDLSGTAADRLFRDAHARFRSAWFSAMENGRALAGTEQRLRASLLAYHLADDAARAATEAARGLTGTAAASVARRAIDTGALAVGPLELRTEAAPSDISFDGTVEALLHRVAVIGTEGSGTFEVLRAGTGAEPVFIVVLPGTQSGQVDGAGSNPFDVGGIAEALAEDSRYTHTAVQEALERAGAAPGSTLIIAGYSQGGLHAVNLAGADRLGGRYDVRLVVTAGSPTGWHSTGSSEYLHLEHSADAVPGLDTIVNDDDRHRTTVTLDHPVPPLGRGPDGTPQPWGLGPAHKVENYLEGARLVDTSDAPSLVPATALLATAGATGKARRSSFTAVRRPSPAAGGTRNAGGRGPRAGVRQPGLGYAHDFDR